MGVFTSDSSAFLGIDIGSSSIKVVELKNDKGRARLSTYGYSEKSDAIRNDSKNDTEPQAQLIRDIIAKAGTTSVKAVTALPTYAVFSSVLNFPARLGKKELPSAIHWEAKKVIPLPIEDMILDWKILPQDNAVEAAVEQPQEEQKQKSKNPFKKAEKKSQKGFQKVLLTGAPKKLVNRYVAIFKLAGLQLMSLETESFALVRSLIGTDPSPSMIVNFGALTTTISMVEHSIPILNRSIDIGGRNVVMRIAKSLDISEERAAYFIQDIGIAEVGIGGSVPNIIVQALEPVINEIKYTKNIWQGQFNKEVTKLVLTGGSSGVPGFADYLTQTVEVKTFLGDPWARIMYPEDLKSVLNDVGSKLSVGIGLAMRNIE